MRVCVCVCMCACACFSEYVYFCFFISSFFFTFLFFLPHWLRTGKQSVTRGNDKTTRESVRHEPRVRDWKHSSKSSEGGVLALNIYFPSESSTIGDKEVGRSARVIYFAKCSQSFVTWLSVLSPGLASWKFIAMDRRLVAGAPCNLRIAAMESHTNERSSWVRPASKFYMDTWGAGVKRVRPLS